MIPCQIGIEVDALGLMQVLRAGTGFVAVVAAALGLMGG